MPQPPPAPEAIELRHLRAFVAVAEELNFGRAAARLYVTQPALSRQIGSLERTVGRQLLRRSTRSVEMTLAGEVFLVRTRELLRDLDMAVNATRSMGDELEERIAQEWAPVSELLAKEGDINETRAAFEAVSALYAVPDGVEIRPINAGGVPGLTLAPSKATGSVLYLHGGGMVLGSAYGFRSLAGALAVEAEATVVVPDYRLAPEHPFPAAINDAVRAYEWMLSQGFRADEITVCGDSMGAMLALSLILRVSASKSDLPARIVLFCPVVDYVLPESATPEHERLIRQFAEAYLNGHSSDDSLVNPLLADFTRFPPMLVQAAVSDFTVENAYRLADHAERCGVPVELDLYPLAGHVFQMFWPFLPAAATALEKAGRYIRDSR